MMLVTFIMPVGASNTDVGGGAKRTVGRRVTLDCSPNPGPIYEAAIAAGWIEVDVGQDLDEVNPEGLSSALLQDIADVVNDNTVANIRKLDDRTKALRS